MNNLRKTRSTTVNTINILNKQVTLSAYTYLLSEFIQYTRTKSIDTIDFEERLTYNGFNCGARLLELVSYREKKYNRDLISILNFISVNIWKLLFGSRAKSLEKSISVDHENEYMIRATEDQLFHKYISIPMDMRCLNTHAFVAGIIKGILYALEFPANVTAHYVKPNIVFLIKFDKKVL
jgi:hypothetical protein